MVRETFTLPEKKRKTGEYMHGVFKPASPARYITGSYEKEKTRKFRNTVNLMYFEFAPPKATPAPDETIAFEVTYAVAATPTNDGAMLEIDPECPASRLCNLTLLINADDSVTYDRNKKDGKAEPLSPLTGPEIKMDTAILRSTGRIYIHLRGNAAKETARKSWAEAKLQTETLTSIRLEADASAHLRTDITYQKPFSGAIISALPQPDEKTQSEMRIRGTENLQRVVLDSYSGTRSELKGNPPYYAYSARNLPGSQIEKNKIVLPIPALSNRHAIYASRKQEYIEYITYHKQIHLSTPKGMKFKYSLMECDDATRSGCSYTRPVPFSEEVQDGGAILIPAEAQVAGLWLLEIQAIEGSFTKQGFLQSLAWSFGNYHTLGKYPRWAFWFYFLSLLGGLILGIVFFSKLGKIKRAKLERRKAEDAEKNAIAGILKRDPGFDAEKFKERGRLIAEKIQHAWSAGDMRACRRFLSQGVYNRFRIQLKIMRDFEKRQNAMADFRILGFHIHSRQSSGPYDALVVRLDAEARDTMVGVDLTADAAQKAARKAPLNGFVEYYTFMRRKDAKTGEGSAIDNCSKCGTPFTGEGEITKCKSCGAVMGSGTYDWVLAEITQEIEHGKGRRAGVSKDVSSDRIEDRASFVFWRDTLATLTGKKDYLLRDATEKYIAQDIQQTTLSDIAVGAADLEEYNSSDATLTAKVRIKWSAKAAGDSEIRHRQTVLSLTAAPQDSEGAGFADHSCTTCGAPLPETDAEACSYCRSPIQGKNKDWLLDKVKTTVE